MSRVPMTLRDVFWTDPFFESTWNDFDHIRENMLKETSEFWKGVPGMDRSEILPPRRNWILSRHLSREGGESAVDQFLKKSSTTKSTDDATLRVRDDDNKFEISVDTSQYRPDELKVNVEENRVLSVEGKHEVQEDGRFISQQFSRKYTLPEECVVGDVTSNLSSDGILMITAPKKQKMIEGK